MGRDPRPGASPSSPNDETILALARSGDSEALELLYSEHVESARRLAVLLAGRDAAEDLVAESYGRILALLREGRGPTTNFRAYLHTTIRNRHRDNLRTARERPSSDLPWMLDGEEPRAEDLVEGIDSNGAVAALHSLPASWQQVLWLLEVEGRRPAEVAEMLETSPEALSSLAYRARDGLRRAYLDRATFSEEPRPECRWTRDRLSQHVRGDLSPRATVKVLDHVSSCTTCAGVLADMDALNKRLAAAIFPFVLVAGMKALEASIEGGAAGRLVARLRGRTDLAENGSGATVGTTSGFGGLLAGASVPALVAAVVSGAVILGGSVWALSAGHGDAFSNPVAALPAPTAPPSDSSPAEITPSEVTQTAAPSATPAPVGVVVDAPSASPTPGAAAVPIVVRAHAPSALKIVGCETYGSLSIPLTTGVRYARTRGDGREGPWQVTASAQKGYVLADGSPTRFSGDLGRYFACPPSIGSLSKVSQGDPATDPWDITVAPHVSEPAASTLEVVYVFDSGVLVTGRSGAGWTCREPGGVEVGAGVEYSFPSSGIPFTCTFDYTGTAPPPVTLSVYGQDGNAQIVDPTGKVTLRDDGVVTDEQTFG